MRNKGILIVGRGKICASQIPQKESTEVVILKKPSGNGITESESFIESMKKAKMAFNDFSAINQNQIQLNDPKSFGMRKLGKKKR